MPINAVRSAISANAVAAALKSAGEATGVGFDVLYNMARRESALDPNAKAATSSAAGLFQFIEQTWLGAVKSYGAKYGLGDAASQVTKGASGKYSVVDPARKEAILNLRFDPAKAAALAGELINENKQGLEKALGRAVDAAELYAAHFLGLAGATKLLTAPPDAEAAALLPKAASANKPVFYTGGRARSVGEVIASIARSMNVAAPDRAQLPPLETKSAFRFPDIFHLGRPAPSAPRLAASHGGAPQEAMSLPSLADIFGWRRPASIAPMPPLAIAVLQALDATDSRGDRDERSQSR